MKWLLAFIFLFFTAYKSDSYAQGNDLQLARQYITNGEPQKACDIYQKLFRQDNDTYYPYYLKCLLTLKKFNDAESITKKMMHKHPEDNQFIIDLGDVYTQNGDIGKANETYNDLLKKLPADQNAITTLAMQFYQSANIDYAIKTIEQGRKVLGDNSVFAFSLIPLYRYKGDKPALVNEYLNILQGTPAYITSAENTMSAMFENDTDYNILKSALLKRIQKQPEVTVYIDLLIWQYLQQKDFDQALNQALALNRRNNDDGTSIFELCHTLVGNNAFDAAIRGYDYLIAKGSNNQYYVPAKIESISAKEHKITSGKYIQTDLLDLEKNYIDVLSEFGNGANTAFAAQRLARLQAFKLHKFAEAQKLLENITNIPGLDPQLLASCKLDLGDVYLIMGRQWDATLLYSQVEKDFPNTDVGQDAKFRNAKLSYYTGDFTYAKLQLDVLKAATSQLIANDALNLSLLISDNLHADSAGNALKIYARADLLIFAEEPDKAIQTLDSIDTKYPGNAMANDILMAKARIFIQQKDYNNAVPLLKKIVSDSPADLWADDAIFMLGDIYDNQLNDKVQAKAYYQKIITDYPGSLWINESRKRFRIIRGDQPTS